MKLIRPGSTLLLLCAACVAVVPSCYRIEIALERFDAGGAASGESGGVAGQAAESGGGPAEAGGIGSACDSDRDCDSPGLSCLRASGDADPLGAPAKGLCSAACSSDDDCRIFDQSAVCGSFTEPLLADGVAPSGAARWCLQGCNLGEPSGSAKCHGRAEMACRPFAGAGAQSCPAGLCPNGQDCFRGRCRATACGPRCNDDSDCADGRHCNAQNGLCDLGPDPVVPIGTRCEAGSTSECGDGVCLQLALESNTRRYICTQSCTLGSSCAQGTGACILVRFDQFAVGDVGYCAKTCNCDDDCSAGDSCYAWINDRFGAQFKSAGHCLPTHSDESSLACSPGSAGSK